MIIKKSAEEIEKMRTAGLVVGRTLELLREATCPGITTRELDALAEDHIRSSGATPSFLGYHGFPGSICVSVNDEVVHGIPGDRLIAEGDVVSLDCGATSRAIHSLVVVVKSNGARPPPSGCARVLTVVTW